MSKEEKGDNKENNPEEGKEAVTEPQKEEKLITMKKGDYNVHILIEEVKNLIEIEEGELPVPRVKMTVFGKSQRTTKMKKPCDSFVFNEHFYYDKTNLSVEMLDSEKITIEVYDNKHTHKQDYFGIYEIDFGYVYNQEDHALHNIWIGLANPESDNISKIRGYLKLSVSVLQEKDSRILLESADNELSNCIIPAQIQMKYKQISFYFFLGEEFPDMDSTFSTKTYDRRCDGYIEVKYMGIVRKTKVSSMGNKEKVVWNQIIDIPATKPAVSQKICMVVKDQDEVGSDDIVGSIELKIDDIYAGHYDELQYLNVYGSPINKKGGIYDEMNYNAEIGSKWNGKILMKCVVSDVDSPIARVTDIPEDIVTQAMNIARQVKWKVWVRIISAMYVPEDSAEYAIRVSIQEKTWKTQPRTAVNGVVDFEENNNKNILLNTFSSDKFELPDIFIYLIKTKNKIEKQNICFQRVKASVFHLCKDIMVLKLLPDPCIGECKNFMKSGLLKCKIFVYNPDVDTNIPSDKEFNSDGAAPQLKTLTSQKSKIVEVEDDDLENLMKDDAPEEEPPLLQVDSSHKYYTVVAIVYMSKELIAAESDGTSDPFVTLTLGADKLSTSVKNNTMNGIWNEKLVFKNVYMDINDYKTWPIFLLSVFDYNKIKSNVPLGYNYVWLCNGAYMINSTDLREPKWHKLFLPKSNKQQGQILLSFYIFDSDKANLIDSIKYTPEVSLYNFEISILGLRQLKPLGMIAVKKPYIKFDLNSLNVTGKPDDAHANIQTVPVSGGANPTINTVIKFDAKLPTKDIFMPELQCEVYDHMLAGLHNSLLGVFSINLKRIINKTSKQIQEDINNVNKKHGMNILSNQIRNSLKSGLLLNVDKSQALIPEEEDDNLISTSSNKNDITKSNDPLTSMLMESQEKEKNKNDLLKITNTINNKDNDNKSIGSDNNSEDEQFLEADENKVEVNNSDQVNVHDMNMNKVEIAIPMEGRRLSVKNTLKLDGNFLKNNINASEYFVLYPNLKYYKIPGYEMKQLNIDDNGEESQKIQKEFLMEDTSKAPDKKLYFEIGYLLKAQEDIKPEETTKHYRRIYGCPLENVDVPEFKIKSPFNVGKIRRGQYVDKSQGTTTLFDAMKDTKAKILHKYGEENMANDDKRSSIGSQISQVGYMGEGKDEKAYGKFKGLIRIANKDQMSLYESKIQESKVSGEIGKMKNLNKYEILRKRLINKKNIIIRAYILELNNLAKKDLLSESDPYIKILLNDKEVINERKNYQDNQKNCKWYKYYDISGEIPGSSSLKIEVWDWDELLTDDLIGYTVIDLEDRYYNDDWQNMKHKPVEVRPLLHPDINGAQGQVYLWLEMFDASEKSAHLPWKIDPQPLCELQVRFIIWETEDMEMMDVEGTSDIYVIGYIDQKELQKTDIHFRCQTGAASFNWRMLLPLRLPVQKPVITLQVYDKDIFSSDDYMCGTTIDLQNIINIPKNLEMPISLNRDFYEGLEPQERKPFGEIQFLSKEDDEEGTKFWVQCYKGKKEAAGQGEKSGRVMCSLEILPKKNADLDVVGKGRDNPNVNPYLPPPVGRLEFTLNPFKMMNQCVGPKFRRKCYCYCLCALLVAYLIFALPTIFSGILF